MLHSIPFFPSENGNPAVPGKATKASSSTKRSIADSEDKSEAYKSIFTTHSSAKRSKEECSNWVTHTAYYFWNNEEPQGAPLAPLLPQGSLCQLWHKLLSWSWLQFLGLEVGNKAVRGWGTCVSCSFCSVRSRQHNPWWSSRFHSEMLGFLYKNSPFLLPVECYPQPVSGGGREKFLLSSVDLCHHCNYNFQRITAEFKPFVTFWQQKQKYCFFVCPANFLLSRAMYF